MDEGLTKDGARGAPGRGVPSARRWRRAGLLGGGCGFVGGVETLHRVFGEVESFFGPDKTRAGVAERYERIRQMGDLIMKLDVPENQALLDEIMANHLIRYPFFAEKAAEYPEVTTISGRILPVDAGQSMIGGAQFYPTQINTKKGSVLWMMDIIDFPEEKLRKAPGQK